MSQATGRGAPDCIAAFSETDTSEDLRAIDVPTLILHGDEDQIVPIVAAAQKSVKLDAQPRHVKLLGQRLRGAE